MKNHKYRLFGYLDGPREEPLQIPGIYQYLEFIILNDLDQPLLVVPAIEPAEGLRGLLPNPEVIITPEIKEGSTLQALEAIQSSDFKRPLRKRQTIILPQQIICRDCDNIYIADTKDLHIHYQRLLRSKKRGIRGFMNSFSSIDFRRNF